MQKSLIQGWENLKAQENIDHYVYYLDAVSALHAHTYKRQTFELLRIRPGAVLLDVGCGLGEDAQAMAAFVGREGFIVGVDWNEPLISRAKQRLTGLSLPVAYCVGDAKALAFADQCFDGCRVDRTLLHLPTPQQAFAEIVRVAKPGARVVVSEVDWGTLIIDASEKELTRRILTYHCDLFPNGWIGRQLPGLFKDHGLTEIRVIPDTGFFTAYRLADKLLRLREAVEFAQAANVISATEAASWLDDLHARSLEGRFFSSVTLFMVAGTKP